MKNILKGEEAIQYYNELKKLGYILFECIVGSQAYGTALPTSDVDIKFVYCEKLDNILGNTIISQLIITDDYVGFELAEFFELLAKQSPNMHELVWTPNDCIKYCNPKFKELIISQKKKFISKQIRYSFAEYADSQIQKARGLNKKIVNPIPKERKTPLDFCWVPYNVGSISVIEWLNLNNLKQEYCGLIAIDHMKYNHHLFYDFPSHAKDYPYDEKTSYDFCILASKYGYYWSDFKSSTEFYALLSKEDSFNYKGIIKKENSNDISLSSIPKNMKPLITMEFNKEGYTKYCKDYKEYWDWVEKRNEVRYNTNMKNGAQYDTKNMMHCHRLLDTCIEALRDNVINVRRPNREQLLSIRNGEYEYENLLKDAEEKIEKVKQLYSGTTMQENVSKEFYIQLLKDFRYEFLF